MKYLFTILVMAALLCSTVGCVSHQTTQLIKALAKDPATVSAKIVTPWGTASLVRVGGSTNSVSVSQDGTVSINSR